MPVIEAPADAAIRQNTAMVEQTSAATTHLLREVEVLRGQTGTFKRTRRAVQRKAGFRTGALQAA
ncbi:hypothetical protein [Sphingomonas sp.]|uniref:hypothetical protein n=1 Tax=Sphingomonas sp. TaxID=28214 RepID=UPI002FDADE70